MLSKLIVAVSLLTLSIPAARADEWTTHDTVLEASYVALALADWSLTLGIEKANQAYRSQFSEYSVLTQPYRYSEANFILGKHPSKTAVNTYFIATTIGHVVLARVLPNPWRRVFQSASIGVEVVAIGSYRGKNISMTVPW